MKYGNQFKPTTPFVLRFLLLAKSRHIHSILHESCSQRSQTVPQTVSSNCNFPQSKLSSLIPAPQAKAHSHSATTVHNCQLVKHLTIEVPSPFRAHLQHEMTLSNNSKCPFRPQANKPTQPERYSIKRWYFSRRPAIHYAWEQYHTLLQVLKTNRSKSRSFKPNEYPRKTLQRSCHRCPTFTNEIPHRFPAEKSLTVLGTPHDSGIPLYCSASIRVSFHRPPMFPAVQNTFIQTK